jgi:hypothetical protein
MRWCFSGNLLEDAYSENQEEENLRRYLCYLKGIKMSLLKK